MSDKLLAFLLSPISDALIILPVESSVKLLFNVKVNSLDSPGAINSPAKLVFTNSPFSPFDQVLLLLASNVKPSGI